MFLSTGRWAIICYRNWTNIRSSYMWRSCWLVTSVFPLCFCMDVSGRWAMNIYGKALRIVTRKFTLQVSNCTLCSLRFSKRRNPDCGGTTRWRMEFRYSSSPYRRSSTRTATGPRITAGYGRTISLFSVSSDRWYWSYWWVIDNVWTVVPTLNNLVSGQHRFPRDGGDNNVPARQHVRFYKK